MPDALREILIGAAGLAIGAVFSAVALAVRLGVKSAIRFAVIEEKQKYLGGQVRMLLRRAGISPPKGD